MTQLCPRCGTPVRPRLQRCGVCGVERTPTAPVEDAAGSVAAIAGRASPWALAAGIFATVFVLITLLGAALLFGGGGGGADTAAPADTTSSSPAPTGGGEAAAATAEPTEEPALPSESPTASATPGAFDPAALPPGLFCRDLLARGLAYPDAVAYWDYEGRPERMDADGNDVPCETVYPQPEIDAYWQ